MTCDKQRVLSWAMSVLLVAGTGAAFAQEVVAPDETVDESPTTGDSTTTTKTADDGDGADGTSNDSHPVDSTTPINANAADDGADDASEDDSGDDATNARPHNHGKVVSEAAHDHSHDVACGNHGRYVSGMARTGERPACASGDALAPGDGDTENDPTGSEARAKPNQ